MIRVDLHCHSVHSDGVLSPREIALQFASGEVAAASLTDHDTLDGLAEFGQALAQRQVGFVPGVEITTHYREEEVHLLAYGIDPAHTELQAALLALRHARPPGTHSVAGALRRKGTPAALTDGAPAAAPEGRIALEDAIALVHRAGGRAFLAHPLLLTDDPGELEPLLAALQQRGLDGVEAIYAPYTEAQQHRLCELASRLGLLVSGGTDGHERRSQNQMSAGVEMPLELWKAFRDAVGAGAAGASQPPAAPPARPRTRLRRRQLALHAVLPTLLAIALFITAIYAVFLPTFERSLLERKREMIRELTNSAWSILAGLERDVQAGRLSRAEAQATAISRIESLRYGREGKDYFWLQDLHPRIIMHPYRKDLNGRDVSGFRDPRGVAIFVEFADLVRRGKEGYAKYVWQWKDDPSRLVPKESYLKGFEPWGWIIGTGIYIEDVKQEIGRIEGSLVRTSLLISVVVVLLLLYVMLESLRLERERAEAEEGLRESTERYRALVSAATEGMLLVTGGRCRYANPVLLDMLRGTPRELELLDLSDLFPVSDDNAAAWEQLNRLLRGEEAAGGFDGLLRRRDGTLLECVLAASRISFAGRSGFILLVRSQGGARDRAGRPVARDQGGEEHLEQLVGNLPVGVFRARATSRGTVVAHNSAAARLLPTTDTAAGGPYALADLFLTAADYAAFLHELRQRGSAARRLHLTARDRPAWTVAITASLVSGDHGVPPHIDGVIEDVTRQEQGALEREATIERLQTSLLFLHEPVSRIAREAVFCLLDTPIHAVAAMMTEHRSSAILVEWESGRVVGIVTDQDLRQRVVAAGLDRGEPVHRIMSSPLVTIPERAGIYEALMAMEQRDVQHLAVTDEAGQVVGIVRNQELLQFRSYGPIVLAREVERATAPEEVVRWCRRVPELARALLDCGARPHFIAEMMSSVCNAATVRLVALAEAELGPAPVPFVFLALGSQGRQEMTLSSDQDNAILYQAPGDPALRPRVEEHLLALGRFVCEWLNRAGYPLCRGDVMARNPRWCQPLETWKQYFGEWTEQSEPQQVLEFAIFFDFRPVCGASELSHELRRHVHDLLRARPSFLPHLAQHALLYKPPPRWFGQPDQIDLKDALMPIVSFARVYALRHEVEATHTLHRVQGLATAGVLPPGSSEEIVAAYELLLRLRLQSQASAHAAGRPADNLASYRGLGRTEQTLLGQSFAQISALQKRISYDFLGGASA